MNSSDVGGVDRELVSRFNEGQAPQEMHHLWDCAVAPVDVGYDSRVRGDDNGYELFDSDVGLLETRAPLELEPLLCA